jgi:hypothetical protein
VTCQEAIALLADYLETVLGPDVHQALEGHLRDCEPCRAYLNTYQRTRDLAADAQRVEMPEEMRRRLRAFLVERLARDEA